METNRFWILMRVDSFQRNGKMIMSYKVESKAGHDAFLIDYDKIVPIIESLRQISLEATFPELNYLLKGFISGIIILTLGWIFFRRVQPAFMDLL